MFKRNPLRKTQNVEEIARHFPQMKGEIYTLAAFSASQLGQDIFAAAVNHFNQSRLVVEVGVGDGIGLSNSLSLETKLLWDSVLVEPNPTFVEQIEKSRPRSELFPVACSDVEGLVTLSEAGLYSGARDSLFSRHAWRTVGGKKFKCRSQRLETILATSHPDRKTVGFLSIDTEGSELQVLHGIDFGRTRFEAITVEHNGSRNEEKIAQILVSAGYREVFSDISAWESWWVSSSNPDFS